MFDVGKEATYSSSRGAAPAWCCTPPPNAAAANYRPNYELVIAKNYGILLCPTPPVIVILSNSHAAACILKSETVYNTGYHCKTGYSNFKSLWSYIFCQILLWEYTGMHVIGRIGLQGYTVTQNTLFHQVIENWGMH